MNQRTAKREAKAKEPDAIRDAFLKEVKRLNKRVWARTVCTVVPDGPDAVWFHAEGKNFPEGYLKVRQALHKGRKP